MTRVSGCPRILVVRRENIGDLVLTTPLIHALRVKFPDAYIACLVNSYNAPVLAGNPDVDRIYASMQNRHRVEGTSAWGVLRNNLSLYASAWRDHFDFVILATIQYQKKDLRMVRAMRPRQVVAFVDDAGFTMPGVDLPVPLSRMPQGHLVHQLEVLGTALGIEAAAGPSRVYPDEALLASNRAKLMAELPGSSDVVGIHISSRVEAQRWPAEKFVALIQELHCRKGCRFLLFWSPGSEDNPLHPGDDAKARRILEGTKGLPVLDCPTERLEQLVAGLACCDRVICSDGGAMHLAAALAKPIVCFFGHADPRRWYPWSVPHVLLQPATRQVKDIEVDEVLEADSRLLEMLGAGTAKAAATGGAP